MGHKWLLVMVLGLVTTGCAGGLPLDPPPARPWRPASWSPALPWLAPAYGPGRFVTSRPPAVSPSEAQAQPSPLPPDKIPHPPGPLSTPVLPMQYGGLSYGMLGYGGFGYPFALAPWRPLEQNGSILAGIGPR